MPLTFEVHKFIKVPGTDQRRLHQVIPYLRLRGDDAEYPVFVQQGRVYAEGGPLITDLPAWFWDEARKVSPVVRHEVGLRLPEEGQMVPVTSPTTPQEIVQPSVSQEPPVMSPEELRRIVEGMDLEGEPEDTREVPVPVKTWTCTQCQEPVSLRAKGLHIARHVQKEMKATKSQRKK